MKNKGLWIVVLLLIGGGAFGAQQYTSYRCTNDNAESWEYHRLISCDVYFDEGGTEQEVGDIASLIKIEGVYIPSFEELDMLYSKDAQDVYYKGIRVARASASSFKYFGGEYFVDSHSAYFRGQQIPESDSRTFALFDDGDKRYAKDATQEYFEGSIIEVMSVASTSRFLLSPYNGEEITHTKNKEIFWRPVVDGTIDSVSIALLGESGTFAWITDESKSNSGSYIWNPSDTISSTSSDTYSLVFYGHTKQGGTKKIDTLHQFTIVEKGKPGVQLKVEFLEDDIVEVSPEDTVYVSWASSNVEHCYLGNNIEQSLVGHMTARFPQSGDAKVTDHLYTIECVAEDGESVEDEIRVRSIAQ